jgi:DNA-binding NarL/FixJ family response regulator
VLGYVLRKAADAALFKAVRRADAGESYWTPRLGSPRRFFRTPTEAARSWLLRPI